uniref:Uncharacterized protein n=1 Tax=Rhizophora mucronata TaxID=61149 RepID=A0A2P2MIN0_RHIMU
MACSRVNVSATAILYRNFSSVNKKKVSHCTSLRQGEIWGKVKYTSPYPYFYKEIIFMTQNCDFKLTIEYNLLHK